MWIWLAGLGRRPRVQAVVEDDAQDQSKAQEGVSAQCTDEQEHLQDAGCLRQSLASEEDGEQTGLGPAWYPDAQFLEIPLS